MLDQTTIPLNIEVDDPLVQEFERNGYVLLPQVISPERVVEVRRRLLEECARRKEQGLNPNKGLKDVLFDVYARYPDLLDTLCNPQTLDALKRILGSSFIVPPDTSALREYYGTLHTDTTGNEQLGWMFHKDPAFRIVTTGLYLQDQTPEYGGGLLVVPGSHKRPDPYVKVVARNARLKKSKWLKRLRKWSGNYLFNYDRQLNEHPEGVELSIKAGDCVIFDMRIFHRATHPASTLPAPDGGKFAIYSRCSANNVIAKTYVDYMYTKLAERGYDYLLQPRNLEALREAGQTHGFEAL